ncbi:MAG TPA: type II toxin-antitoxin system prevent-host-death family antitoxin [Planctomycetota bacterium]|jgi:prevent-host-death family protein
MASGRFVRTNELQHNPSLLLQDVSATGETCYITENGRAKAVLMDINRYNALMDLVEEAESPKDHEVGEETRRHVSVKGIMARSTTLRRRRV